MTDEELIRKIELTVLDEHCKTFRLMGLPEDLAITRLLKLSGDLSRVRFDESKTSSPSPSALHRYHALKGRGLSHCLRWVCSHCPSGSATQNLTWQEEEKYASELLQWGMKYAELVVEHIAWSKKAIEAKIDNQKRVIEFGYPEHIDEAFYFKRFSDDIGWFYDELIANFPDQQFTSLFNSWQQHACWTSNGLEFDPDFVRRHKHFSDLEKWVSSKLFPELPHSRTLGSYTLGNLRSFYSTMFLVCLCISTLEEEVDRRAGQTNNMGSWVFQASRADHIEWLSQATGLSIPTTDSIVSDLTLDIKRFHCSITTTPFVLSRQGTLFVLPRQFSHMSPQRTFASALTSGSGRRHYESIAGEIEQFQLENVANYLKTKSLKVIVEKEFRSPSGQRFKPDLIICDRTTNDIVVADFKNALAASATPEVMNRLKEFNKGVRQVEKYISLLEQYPNLLEEHLKCAGKNYRLHGLLIYRVPMPMPIPLLRTVEVESWYSLRTRLDDMYAPAALDIIPKYGSIALHTEMKTMKVDTLVGDWTYRRTVGVLPNK